MIILALDTTSEWGGVGVFRDEECLFIAPAQETALCQGHIDYSVSLFRDADEALKQTRLSLKEVDLFAASSGPGAFTGIRVGLAAVQGWADALQRPWRGVTILEAMVESAGAGTPYALPVLDARRGDLYAGLFKRAPDSLHASNGCAVPVSVLPLRFIPTHEGALLKPGWVIPFLRNATCADGGKSGGCTVISRENDAAAGAIETLVSPPYLWKTVAPCLVPAIARLAFRAAAEGRPARPEETTAFYIRRTDAELHLNERARGTVL